MQTDRPTLGICLPHSTDLAYNRLCWPQYGEAVRSAGGHAMELPLNLPAGTVNSLLDRCAGFILPGSPADIDPAHYGEDRQPSTSAADPAREFYDLLVLEHAARTGKPILGICFGLQSMNIWRGGSLIQDVTPVPVNHAAGNGVAVAHTALVANTSLLGSLLSAAEAPSNGSFRRLPVNSSHHQAVSRPGDDLTVVARCPEDGVVEAVEGRIGLSPMLGVQWHPERSAAISAGSLSLFLWLVSSAADGMEALDEATDERPA